VQAQDECKTLYQVIHNHLPDLTMSPVAAKIFDNPALKGETRLQPGGSGRIGRRAGGAPAARQTSARRTLGSTRSAPLSTSRSFICWLCKQHC
jgi:hypothetical protein